MPTLQPITTSPTRLRTRAAVARACQEARRRPGDEAAAQAVADARRAYKFATLEDHVREVVDAAPALTPTERDQLAMLLRGSS